MKSIREKVIANYYAPHKHQDLLDIYQWLSSDVLIQDVSQVPWSGNYYGLEGVGVYLSTVTRYILSEITVEDVFTCAGKVFVIGRSRGRVRSNGYTFDIRVLHQYTFDEQSKIVKIECYSDSASLLDALNTNAPAQRLAA